MHSNTRSGPIVAKFGGTSLADATQIRKAAAIVMDDKRRIPVVIVSAPGKRSPDDAKVTDLLLAVHAAKGEAREQAIDVVLDRFRSIARDLPALEKCLERDLPELAALLRDHSLERDHVVSRGEWLTARMFAHYIGGSFIDAAQVIRFDPTDSEILAAGTSASCVRQFLRIDSLKPIVIPGFYGNDQHGRIRTFSRGGSDITGAIVAAALGAAVYENWTDVDGVYETDPSVIADAKPIPTLTYRELRELSYTGAGVFHHAATPPVKKVGIPVRIANTNRPEMPGTWVIAERDRPNGGLLGMAGKKGFSALRVSKDMGNEEVGFAARALGILVQQGIGFDHVSTSTDGVTFLLPASQVDDSKLGHLIEQLRHYTGADDLSYTRDVALLTVVGEEGSTSLVSQIPRLLGALDKAQVKPCFIGHGDLPWTFTVGVKTEYYALTCRVLHQAAFRS